MAGKMADYLPQKTADYTGSQLTVTPQTTLVETPQYTQKLNMADDGSSNPTTLDSDPFYDATLQWRVLGQSDAETIIDMWADPSKAKGVLYTFEWPHPTDGNTYIVRFKSNPQKNIKPANRYEVPEIKLRVEGYK